MLIKKGDLQAEKAARISFAEGFSEEKWWDLVTPAKQHTRCNYQILAVVAIVRHYR